MESGAYWSYSQIKNSVSSSSSSGGFCHDFACFVLNEGYQVYGFKMTEDFHVICKKQATQEDLESFRGSKYVFSSMGGEILKIKSDLLSGEKVCFFGLPCQSAAIKKMAYTIHREDHLFCITLLCGGGINPNIYRSFCSLIKKRYGNFSHLNFRDHSEAPVPYVTSIVQTNGRKKCLNGIFNSLYLLMSLGYLSESCFSCQIHENPKGDLLVGDAHGFQNSFAHNVVFASNDQEIFKAFRESKRGNLSFLGTKNEKWVRFKKEKQDKPSDYEKAVKSFSNNFEDGFKRFVLPKLSLKTKVYLFSPYIIKRLFCRLAESKR
jgi:hypothetical protein